MQVEVEEKCNFLAIFVKSFRQHKSGFLNLVVSKIEKNSVGWPFLNVSKVVFNGKKGNQKIIF